MFRRELGGVVSEVEFQNGGEAKKGDVLLKLDASAEEALLQTAEADLELARADLERDARSRARKVVSKQELDAAESTFGQKQGTVDHMRSFIAKKQVHRAVRWAARHSPGERRANDQRRPASGAADALDPVFVDFALPQQYLGRNLTPGLEVHVHTDAAPGPGVQRQS